MRMKSIGHFCLISVFNLQVRAPIKSMSNAVKLPNLILRKISLVCTDGTNVNTGDKFSLWVLLDKEMKAAGSNIPVIKIWCAAHRSELAWKIISKSVPEISKVLTVLSSISSYFHQSAIRTAELKQIASEHNLRLLNMPKIFEIRWSQFTFSLVRSVLVSWNASVIYFKNNGADAVCAGHHKYLTQLENVALNAFLADLLFAFSRFQKKLQSDQLTLISMKTHTNAIRKTLNGMETVQLPGAFESNLGEELLIVTDGLKSIELQTKATSRSRQKEK